MWVQVPFLAPAGMAELVDALDSGSSEGSFMKVQVLLPAPKNRRYRQVSPVFLCESNGLSKLYAKESAKDDSFASSRRLGAEGHQVLLPAPNSRNPNLMPIGDGFGFLFVLNDNKKQVESITTIASLCFCHSCDIIILQPNPSR